MITLPHLPPRSQSFAYHVDVVMTPDGPVTNAVVRVEHGCFTYVGPAEDYSGEPAIRVKGAAIVPGILDVHHHIIEPFAKALTGGEPAQLWKRFWLPLEAASTPESVYDGATWTFIEALRAGITTIVDHGIRSRELADAIHRAADGIGIRLVSSTGAYDLKNYTTSANTPKSDASPDDAITIALQHIADCEGFDRVTPSLACGTVQSNSQDMIVALSGLCREKGLLFQIHANEHTLEVHASIEATGKRPIELLHHIGALGPNTLIAHATLITADEIRLLRETDTAVAYCPVASMWKGNAVAPVLDYFANGIRVGLGSDATRNDGFRMIDAAEAAQRIAYGMPRDDFSCGEGWRWFDTATRGGAAAAMLGQETGSLAPGYKADFLILDSSGPEVLPQWDFAWELVRFYDRADILATFVEGEQVMVGGKVTRFDGAAFMERALPEGIEAIHKAKLLRLHGHSERYRKRQRS